MSGVFIKKMDKRRPSYPIGALLGRMPSSGDVGLEIEVEGSHLPKEGLPKNWSYHNDGSLRGKDNAEYVLTKPVTFDEVPKMLEKLWDCFGKSKSTIDESNRTSVHVHLNCQEFHMNRLASFVALWFCVEEVLTEWCGEHRVGNMFCLRAKDAPAVIPMIRRFILSEGVKNFPETTHYAGLNVHALNKFGSLEVRTLRGVPDPAVICDWVSILRRLYELSGEYPDPRDICGRFSQEGPSAFFSYVLGDQADVIRRGISHGENWICDSMYEGIRLAQDICFCRDWGTYKPVKLKDDPFGRDPRLVINKVKPKSVSLNSPASAATLDAAIQQMTIQMQQATVSTFTTDAPIGNWGAVPVDPFHQ